MKGSRRGCRSKRTGKGRGCDDEQEKERAGMGVLAYCRGMVGSCRIIIIALTGVT